MIPYQTETHLKSYLDTNQLARERMCLAVLSIDKRFSNLRPRHPRGGPDKGVDIDAVFNTSQVVAAAIGFMVGANDSAPHKRTIQKKFKSDVESALRDLTTPDGQVLPKPEIFVFLTNLDLTVTEENKLITFAKGKGFAGCEIMDRERIRIALDSVDGFASRFQYLGIALSEAEQASFFSRWGDDIQSVIATGFTSINQTLNRVLFLQEAGDVLNGLYIRYELDREYSAAEIGHFRTFVAMTLNEPKLNIFQILFGASDKSGRYNPKITNRETAGIAAGKGGGYWEHHIEEHDDDDNNDAEFKWENVGTWSSVGQDPVSSLTLGYDHDPGLIRLRPRLKLADMQKAMYIHYLNASLAKKVIRIHVMANGYKLGVYERDQFHIDESELSHDLPVVFTGDELKDPWVKIKGAMSCAFRVDFSDWTPTRMFVSREVPG
ncbi:hypothetical protein [Rhizobium ruizarguesonis]|uniref:hypothetical protein n=1 Tax=Rhizobium ruizarguesonis TaxID=2081791 RepID=UPI0010302E35|nr:hypothetical protein [Rhizobium ruizarguesonis]TBC89003.1 hypothetical protein ELH25_35965 [Rhizobium ruizarguesonis]TBD07986.1 hypothetical protein ELH24_35955 [Rhizobium ruizarguesonis]TBD24729.1 hypothetical protein ELH19_34745 [Rhizobium ruizarguesonis]TBD25214.1 hypothetical protein ELH19_34645 [Rhizobium ruizarguesonis]TBD31223.1 hypothetical protein ELH18_32905 [Rhizobium ruizarguesonis]